MLDKNAVMGIMNSRKRVLSRYLDILEKGHFFTNTLDHIIETIRKTSIEIELLNLILDEE